MSGRVGAAAPLLAAVLLLSSACGAGASGSDGGRGSTTTLRVFAATSVRAVFSDLESSFEAAHQDVDVELTFGGSSGLAAQIEQGAPADVLATADEQTMSLVVDETGSSRPTVFARNRLAIIVEPGNPEGIVSLRDLGRPGLVVVLCAPAVPCGRLAAAALDAARVAVVPRSLEENVGGVRSKVELGEADAGIVYATDALDAGDAVTKVDAPQFDDAALEAVYPIAVLDGAPREAAEAWVDHVLSPAGRSALSRAGFLAP